MVDRSSSRPGAAKLGLPLTHWSLRKLAAYLAASTVRTIKAGRERLPPWHASPAHRRQCEPLLRDAMPSARQSTSPDPTTRPATSPGRAGVRRPPRGSESGPDAVRHFLRGQADQRLPVETLEIGGIALAAPTPLASPADTGKADLRACPRRWPVTDRDHTYDPSTLAGERRAIRRSRGGQTCGRRPARMTSSAFRPAGRLALGGRNAELGVCLSRLSV